MRRNGRLEVALVDWLDASYNSGATTMEEAAKATPLITHTVGFLLRDDAEVVVVAQDYYDNNDENGGNWRDVRHRTVIPRAMVQRIQRWRPHGRGIDNRSVTGSDSGVVGAGDADGR